jgi:hypothetical protein
MIYSLRWLPGLNYYRFRLNSLHSCRHRCLYHVHAQKGASMKTIACVTLLLAVVLVSLNSCGGTRTETVSAATVAELPPGKSFEIDLTHKGTVYKFDDARIDFSRVTIRTTTGVKTFADLLKETNTGIKGGLVLGTPGDMRNHLPTSTRGTTRFDCGVFCKCNDTNDCIDLIVSGKCGGEFWCSRDTASCFCVAKP